MESTNKSKSSSVKLPDDWARCMNDKYKFVDFLGKGTFGTVYKAKCRATGNIVAVKHLTNIFRNNYSATKVAREIAVMQQLSKYKVSFFARLLDVIIPFESVTTPSTGISPCKVKTDAGLESTESESPAFLLKSQPTTAK